MKFATLAYPGRIGSVVNDHLRIKTKKTGIVYDRISQYAIVYDRYIYNRTFNLLLDTYNSRVFLLI